MTQDLVLDTSVAIAWYLPESSAQAAREWQRRMLDGEVHLWVPGLHFWEIANVLRTYVRRGEIDEPLAQEIYGLHLAAPLKTSEPEPTRVLQTAFSYQATVYDAVFITLALTLEARLLTAERKTRPWVVRLGKRVEQVS